MSDKAPGVFFYLARELEIFKAHVQSASFTGTLGDKYKEKIDEHLNAIEDQLCAAKMENAKK